MEKLISMREMVLNQDFGYGNDLITETEFRQKVTNYAKFLSTPLTLGMFIPTYENGNVLEEPKRNNVAEI